MQASSLSLSHTKINLTFNASLQNNVKKLEMAKNIACGYPYFRTQHEISIEYQHDRIEDFQIVF